MIAEQGIKQFVFDELHMTGNAALHVKPSKKDAVVDIRMLVGDKTGFIHIHDTQVIGVFIISISLYL